MLQPLTTSTIRVFVLEDNPGDLHLLRAMLSDVDPDDYSVTAADCLADALDLLPDGQFDLILSDLNVPDSRGLDTFRALHDRAPGVPVILITGLHDESSALEAVALGAQDYLVKDGLSTDALVRAIRYAIGRNHAEQERRQLVAILEATTDVVWTASPSGRLRFLNGAGRRLFGIDAQEDVSRVRLEDYYPSWTATLMQEEAIPSAIRDGIWLGETAVLARGEAECPMSQMVIAHRSPAGGLLYLSGIARDISERKRTEAHLAHLAHYDPVTGLPNRDLFRDRLNLAMHRATRHGTLLAVLFIDLDNFKDINDSLGHSAGDDLLRQVGMRLGECLRSEDTVARLGGDEFTVLIEDLESFERLQVVLDKLLTELSRSLKVADTEVFVTASIGATLYPIGDADADTLLKQADAAMYQAKSSGRNNYQFYSHELQLRIEHRLMLATDLRRAIGRGEFHLEYQPQVDVRTGQVRCVEALLRWNHPREGMISPSIFIPIAEETGQIASIGEWVLQEACSQCREWRAAGIPHARVAVNISARQFRLTNLAETIRAALDTSGLPADALELEITEGLMMENIAASRAVLRELQAMGVEFAVDDFGTGYSSLAYLKDLPLSHLKIDRSFVRDLPGDANSVAIARSILAMSHHLGLSVIAEGVERQAQFRFLLAERCDAVQGFLLAAPLRAAEAEALLRNGVRLPDAD